MNNLAANASQYLMTTYKRAEVKFVRGEGTWLFDEEGRAYLDLLGGIAVLALGHSHPAVSAAISRQASILGHVSNLFYTEPMLELAAELQRITGWGRSFFCNSGAEANECAIKLVRKWGNGNRWKILCADGDFHGRTMATLSATGQPEKWNGFAPMLSGFSHLPYNDLKAFENGVDLETAAIFVEPIQGERGVIPATPEFLSGLRELCSRHSIPLVFDEVQTGVGRTGSWWAFQTLGVKPDIFTTAKALGNGMPIGACIADEPFASVFTPGDHGTTFGGGPIICAAVLATLNTLREENILENVRERGEEFKKLLSTIPGVQEVRGHGLIIGAELRSACAKRAVALGLEEYGLILNAPSETVLRFVPPLTISSEEVKEASGRLDKILERIADEK